MKLTQLGTEYGGWVVPLHLLDAHSVCYCAGAGEDVSFDVALIRTAGCHVHVFDPTPRAAEHLRQLKRCVESGKPMPINGSTQNCYIADPDQIKGKLHFFENGLWSENTSLRFYEPKDPTHVSHSIVNLQQTDNYFVAECKTLRSIMQELGHTRIDLLKLDIEGAEHAVLAQMMAEGIRPRIVCIEFDTALQQPNRSCEAVRDLRQMVDFGYDLLHVENWNATLVTRTAAPNWGTRWRLRKLARRAARNSRRAA